MIIRLFLKYVTIIFFTLSCSSKEDNSLSNYNYSLAALFDSLNIDSNQIIIHIDKSRYRLSIFKDTLLIKDYPVVLGGNPVDDKLQQGDNCTPEGTFKMILKYPHKEWNKFIWIDYPNDESWEKHKAAKEANLIPQDANIGGEIGIHGVPEGFDNLIDLKFNWTLGCISLKNKDVDEIYPYITESTEIIIQK
ncbi:MAG: L,D-transpeptidase [Bacteroidales bacterium]|nr:MAG: L,D-transpeptidase [Bacteroidales bacterium]